MSSALKRSAAAGMAVAVLLLAGCSQSIQPTVNSASQPAKTPASPPQPVTAKTAFWPMHTSARSWATDLVTLRLVSKDVPGFKSENGKAAMWEATFASPTLHQYRVYSYAIANVPPDIHRGVVAGLQQPWTGESRDAMPIDLSFFNIDSDAAYEAAAVNAAAWIKKNPEKQLTSFALGDTYRFQTPVWFLMWGDKKSGYLAFVDATSGKVLTKK
jgi:hypothetical protein